MHAGARRIRRRRSRPGRLVRPSGVGDDPAHVVVARPASPGSAGRAGRRPRPCRRRTRPGTRRWKCAPTAVAGVQEGAAAGRALGVDGAGHHVARGQLGGRVVAGHEGAAGPRRRRIAPSPRRASVASGAGSRPMSMAVGWNWTNSGSAIWAPARAARPRPSPRTSGGGGGDGVEAADAAGGQDHRAGSDLDQARRRSARSAPTTRPVGVLEQAAGAGVRRGPRRTARRGRRR